MAVNSAEDEKRDVRGRLWRYGPLIAWACFVLFASSSSFSASNTSRIIRPLLLWLFPDISEASLACVHFLVRKAAHLSEYGLLALLAARAFRTSRKEKLRRRWWPAAFTLVACVALVDEYHQSFLPARTGTVYDSLLDVTGGAAALACAALWLSLRRRKAGGAGRGL
ncbi:MAG TPA: VanZ family protein [Pyrinomonadaceae bacterium]|jgi:VanZ family protein